MWGKKVAAHAHGAEGIKRAARAGVASIEHGGMIDEEGVRLLKERGIYLVPDIYTDVYILEHGAELGLPTKIIDKSNVNALVKVADIAITGFSAVDGVSDGTTLYVAGIDGGIQIIQ